MKKVSLGVVLIMLCLTLMCAMATAEAITTSDPSDLRTEHPYALKMDQTWTYTHPAPAAALKVTFSPETYYLGADMIIRDAQGNGRYYRYDALAGQTVVVPGNSLTIRFHDDSYYNTGYGFEVTDITAMTDQEYAEYAAPRLLAEDGWVTGLYDPLNQTTRLIIPAVIDGETVSGIAENAFEGLRLTEVVIEEGIRTIGDWAFHGSADLVSISFPASLQSIGFDMLGQAYELKTITYQGTVAQASAIRIAEENSRLKSLPWTCADGIYHWSGSGVTHGGTAWSWADGVLTISRSGDMEEQFSLDAAPWSDLGGCTRAIVFSDGVASISSQGFYAFTTVTDVTIPASVTSIGDQAFNGSSSLRTVHFGGTLAARRTITIGEGNEYLTHALWTCSDGEYAEEYTGTCGPQITWKLRCNTLTLTGRGAMPDYGFDDELRTTVNPPWYDQQLRKYIRQVVIQPGITAIGKYAFSNAMLFDLTLPASVTAISDNAFDNAYINALHYGGTKAQAAGISIGFSLRYALYDIPWECSDGTMYQSLSGSCGTNLSYVYAHYTLTISGSGTMDGGPDWSNYSFSPRVYHLVFESGVTGISTNTLNGLYLDDIVFPASLVEVGEGTFARWEVDTVYYGGTAAEKARIRLGADNDALLSARWVFTAPFSGDFVLPADTVTIEEEAFSGIAATGVRISDAVTTIGARAFAGCPHLEMVWIPSGVTSIADSAFEGCEHLMIYGVPGSAAEAFAEARGYAFVSAD